jgi:3-methylfumaryl-CoA hydratase
MALDPQVVAQWAGRRFTAEDDVSPGAVERYRATLPWALNGDAKTGMPQGLHWTLCPNIAPHDRIGPDGHPEPGLFFPILGFPRRMWAAGTVEFRRPLAIGDRLARDTAIRSLVQKDGASGAMVFATVDHTWRVGAETVIAEEQTIVFRADTTGAPAKPPPPAPPVKWDVERSLTPNEALMFRYAAITFNSHRIHYDLPYTQAVEGYPGLVVQGPLMATLLMSLADIHFGTAKLKRFSFRAVSPAFCGNRLTFGLRRDGEKLVLSVRGEDGREHVGATALV